VEVVQRNSIVAYIVTTTSLRRSSDLEAGSEDPRIARSRAKLLAAARQLLLEGGLRGFTVDAVAERSGVAKSTLYRHWPSVNDLLLDVLRSSVPAARPIDLSQGFEPALRTWMDHAVESLSEPDWPRVLAVLLDLRASSPETAALLDADFEEKLTTLAAILRLGAAEGRLPRRLDARTVTQTLIGPLVLAAVTDDLAHLAHLGRYVVERFLASYPPPARDPS